MITNEIDERALCSEHEGESPTCILMNIAGKRTHVAIVECPGCGWPLHLLNAEIGGKHVWFSACVHEGCNWCNDLNDPYVWNCTEDDISVKAFL